MYGDGGQEAESSTRPAPRPSVTLGTRWGHSYKPLELQTEQTVISNVVRFGAVPTAPARTTTARPGPSFDNTELCRGNLDTIVTARSVSVPVVPGTHSLSLLRNDSTYAFSGSRYWLLTDTAIAPGYPRATAADWDGLPGDLDAAFTWTNGKTYFFKGDKYWRFSQIGKMDRGYPKVTFSLVDNI